MPDDNDSSSGPDDQKDDQKKLRQNNTLLEASSIGLMFPIAMGLGYAWGWGMDKLFHTSPWLTWIFTAFGVIAAFINLFRIGLRKE
ncbi:MAG: synthase protein [Thermoanaerobaculia bacterium]|jgi:F0F1-type ATP synthase assembly protein I|nr:synthase protein [Thermoanaerobaculia bacterium]